MMKFDIINELEGGVVTHFIDGYDEETGSFFMAEAKQKQGSDEIVVIQEYGMFGWFDWSSLFGRITVLRRKPLLEYDMFLCKIVK